MMYNFIDDVFHTVAKASSVVFDLRRQFFADAKIFELGRLYFESRLNLVCLALPRAFTGCCEKYRVVLVYV